MNQIELLTSALNHIEEHLTEELTVEDVAECIHCSKSSLQNLFRAISGYGVKEYIMKRRMTKAARELLEQPEKTILTIAVNLGYNSHEALTRAFVRVWNMTPKEYRQQARFSNICPRLLPPPKGEEIFMRKRVDITELYDLFQERNQCYFICCDIRDMTGLNQISRKAGDLALLETIKRMEEAAGEKDVVFRIGSDEFALLTDNHDSAYAGRIMDQILSRNGETFLCDGEPVPLQLYVCTTRCSSRHVHYQELYNTLASKLSEAKRIVRESLQVRKVNENQLEESVYEDIRKRAALFSHNSMEYVEYEDVMYCTVLKDDEEGIFLARYDQELHMEKLLWAVNDPKILLRKVKEQRSDTLIQFVPPEWYFQFVQEGFKEYGILREYWIQDLKLVGGPSGSCMTLTEADAETASLLSKSCRFQSREFAGETSEWFKEWMNGTECNLNAGDMGNVDSRVLGIYEEEHLAGIVCVAIYAKDHPKGAVLWIRELAVRPEFQNRGYGRKLLEDAFQYGREFGAKRVFLMADDINENAKHLYRSVGFEPTDEVQIDLYYEVR